MQKSSSTSGPESPATVIDMLRRAAAEPAGRGVRLHDSRGRVAAERSWSEVLEHARRAAGRLAAAKVPRRAPVLLALPTSFELIDLWLGCLWHGALPVVTAPPVGMGAGRRELDKLAHVAGRIGADRVIGADAIATSAREAGHDALVPLLATPESILERDAPAAETPAPVEPDEIAFLQLTSGSTGHPRAVIVPHSAAVANSHANDLAIGAPDGRPASEVFEAMVSWLPLHHDMGLVGGVLFSMYAGLDLELFSTRSFLARPELWLAELGRATRAGKTLSPAPNFAYQTCVERVDPSALEGADLGHWHGALIGAEMVRPETVGAMLERFGSIGLDPSAVRSCYGLAEGTLSVTYDMRGEGLRTHPSPLASDSPSGSDFPGGTEVACSGVPVLDTEVAITTPDGGRLPEGTIGEVRAKGPGIFAGYYNDPEASAELLVDGWLRTGDLGFLHAGELYLTGRSKELLILRGQNLMPHELEWQVDAETGGGGTSRSGAFSITRSGEGEVPVLVVESSEVDAEALGRLDRGIRVRVGRELGLQLADLCFVRRGRLPKTTSGKIRRGELRRMYLAGELERIETGPTAAE